MIQYNRLSDSSLIHNLRNNRELKLMGHVLRYVALNTLLRTVHIDKAAVQRHRNTIIECLSDVDISIKKRAMELLFALVNETNVRSVIGELVNFLSSSAPPELKAQLTSTIILLSDKYAPTKRW